MVRTAASLIKLDRVRKKTRRAHARVTHKPIARPEGTSHGATVSPKTPSTVNTRRFPQLKRTKAAAPRLRLLTFPNSGSSENVYTGPDKLNGRADNFLMQWARRTGVEVWAAQPPGRDARLKETALTTCASVAKQAFDAASALGFFDADDAPWALFAHSMGCWSSYEFALLARSAGKRPPTVFVVSGFPSPSIKEDARPWTPCRDLGDTALREECRAWQINEVVFSSQMWATYEPLLRADFTCFDAYPPSLEAAPLTFPVKGVYGTEDGRCTREQLESWSEVSSFEMLGSIEGHHLFVYDEAARRTWFQLVVGALEEAQPTPLLSGPPRARYECIALKGAAVREGCELKTALANFDVEEGGFVDVEEEKDNSKGTLRLRVVAYTAPGCSASACAGWVSKKLFEFRGVAPGAVAPEIQSNTVHRAAPPLPPLTSSGTGAKKVVTGKHGALLRKGCELESVETGIMLEPGDLCYVTEDSVNAQNIQRAHVMLRSAQGLKSWERVDGWCTAKFLTGNDAQEALPEVGSTPLVQIAFPASTSSGHVLLFPGQGAQKVGMLAPYKAVPGVRQMFADASTVFGRDLLELVEQGPEADLNDTRYSQVCVFLTSMAAVAKLDQDDPSALAKCATTAGFSLGEYSALTFAGVMDIATAVRLLKVRSDAMGAACDLKPSGMMTVVGYEDKPLASLLPDGVTVANQLFPKGRVVAGPRDKLKELEGTIKAAKVRGTKTIMQPVSGAFHTPFMASAADALRTALDDVTFSAPTRTVYSNVTALPHSSEPATIKAALCKQLTAGVLWEDTITHLIKEDVAALFEPAPGKQLTSMMRRISPAHHPKMKSV